MKVLYLNKYNIYYHRVLTYLPNGVILYLSDKERTGGQARKGKAMKELYEWIDEADTYIENDGDITFEGVLTAVKESFEDLSSIKTEKEVQDLLTNCGVKSVKEYAKKLYEVIEVRNTEHVEKVKDMITVNTEHVENVKDMITVNTEIGQITGTEYQLNTLIGWLICAAVSYSNEGYRGTAERIDSVGREIYTELDNRGFYDDVKEITFNAEQ